MRPAAPVGWALCAFGAALPLSIAGANIGWALAAAALLWAWREGDRPDFEAARGPLWRPLWAFLAAAAAADLLGRDPGHSLRYLNQDLHKVWVAALLSVAFARERPRALPGVMAAAAALAALIGAGQYLSTLGALPWVRMRAHAFVHPVTYGEQMAVLALGALAALQAGPRSGGRRLPAAAAAALFGLALFLSNTRGAMLACAAGAAAMLFLRPGARKAAAGVLLGAGALYFIMDFLRNDHSMTLEAVRTLAQGRLPVGQSFERLTLWDVAVRMGLDHPWTGAGVNNYRTLLPSYHRGSFEDFTTSWGTAHNLYLHHFAERGLVGLGALGWLLWAMAARAFERARRSPGFWTLWAWGTTVAFLLMNLTEVALQTELVWLLVWTVWLAAEAQARAEGA
ncbi:MAG: O-antigen ligase family protein [Elusimicrobia bacterium]|nr:O-antigen ligase family protein [Elusimicrobiota bacterium]